MSTPLVYLVLGTSGAGRRHVLVDLIENGLAAEDRAVLATAEHEPPPEPPVAAALAALPGLVSTTWMRAEDGRLVLDFPADTTHVFLLADGRGDPADEVERVAAWSREAALPIARVFTVVDCALGHAHPELQRWFEACIHFSDVVLLARRTSVPNAWIGEFTAHIRKQHLPCLVELVKKDGVDNPALVLEPQARRVSTVFDDPSEWPDLEDEDDDAVDDEIDPALVDSIGATDPYLERYPSGRRVKELPDVRRFLDGEKPSQ
jgi:hypothetical protein